MFKAFRRTIFLTFLVSLVLPNTIFAASFGVRPAYPRADNPRTESIFVQTIIPGDSANDGVKVINSTDESKNLILYSRDSIRSSGGGFACTQISETPKGVGTWIKFDIENLEEDIENVKIGQKSETIEITIPAGKEIIIPFKITVPKDASVGEHNGCVLIQEMKSENTSATGVSLSLRSGLRVAINIPGEIKRSLEFSDFKIEKVKKSIYLKPSIKNTGNVSVDTNMKVEVRYFFGLLHEKFGGEFPVLRDETYDFSFELKKPFLGGLYSATAIFEYDSNKDASTGVNSGDKPTKSKTKTVWFFSAPTFLGLVLEIFILLILLFIFSIWRLRKKKQKWIQRWVSYTVAEGETVEKIARQNKIHWEVLVEVNKIRPPFILKEGQEIKIPPFRKSNNAK